MLKKVLLLSLVLFGLLFYQMPEECFADVLAQLEQAETYEKQGYYAEAEEIYKAIVTDYPGTDDAFQAQKRLAILYISWDKQSQAGTAFKELVTEFSEHERIANAVHAVAMHCRGVKKDKRAVELYQYVIDNWPGTDIAVWSQGGVAKSNIALGNEVAAQAAIKKLLTEFPEYEDIAANSAYDTAGQYRVLEKYGRAIELYQSVLDKWPESEFAIKSQKYIAISNILLGNDAATQAAIDKLIANFSGHPGLRKALYGIARRYRWSEKYKEADSLYQQILQQYPDSPYASKAGLDVSRINVLSFIDSGNATDTKAELDRLLADFSEHPDLPETLYNIAGKYEWSTRSRKHEGWKKYEEARSIYQQIIQQYPDSSYAGKARLDVARVNILSLIDSGNDSDAKAGLNKLLVDFSDHPGLPATVSLIAEQYYIKAFRLDESSADQVKEYAQKAVTIWGIVINELPSSAVTPEACSLAGDCYRRMGKYKKSIEYYQKVVDDYPEYRTAWNALFLLGRNYESLRKSGLISKSEADTKIKAAYEQLLDKYPTCKAAKPARRWLSRHNSK